MKICKSVLTVSMLLSVCFFTETKIKSERKRNLKNEIVQKIKVLSKNNVAEQKFFLDTALNLQDFLFTLLFDNPIIKYQLDKDQNLLNNQNLREQAQKILSDIKSVKEYENVRKAIDIMVDYCLKDLIPQLLAADELIEEIDKLNAVDQASLIYELIRDQNLSKRASDKKLNSYMRTFSNYWFDLSDALIDLHCDYIDQYGEKFYQKVHVIIIFMLAQEVSEYIEKKIHQRINALNTTLT